MSDFMIEDELRQTEILVSLFAKTAAMHQRHINSLVLRIIQDEDDGSSSDDDSSCCSDSSITADLSFDDDDFASTWRSNQVNEANADENNAESDNRKRTISDNTSSGSSTKRHRPSSFDVNWVCARRNHTTRVGLKGSPRQITVSTRNVEHEAVSQSSGDLDSAPAQPDCQ